MPTMNCGKIKKNIFSLSGLWDTCKYIKYSIIDHWCECRMWDWCYMDIPGYASSTANSLCLQQWREGIGVCSQSRFPGSSMSYKPDLPHLLKLYKMCLASCNHSLHLILLCRPEFLLDRKACNKKKVTHSFSQNGDFFSTVENCGSFVWKRWKAIGFLSHFSNVRVNCSEVQFQLYKTLTKNLPPFLLLLIINSMHLENRDLPANLNLCSGERTLEVVKEL